MSKELRTRKYMKEHYNTIVKISYCNAQFLLRFLEPIAYSTRTEGWACDYYYYNGVLISTGYAPIESRNTKCDYDTVRSYDDKARDILYGNDTYEVQRDKVTALLDAFIEQITSK